VPQLLSQALDHLFGTLLAGRGERPEDWRPTKTDRAPIASAAAT
jgi:hypothetical protein